MNIRNFEHLVVDSLPCELNIDSIYWKYAHHRAVCVFMYYVFSVVYTKCRERKEKKNKILNKLNQNASLAVPDDCPDRRLIIDLDINQNVDTLCRWNTWDATTVSAYMAYKMCSFFFSFWKMLLLFAPFSSPSVSCMFNTHSTYVYIRCIFVDDWVDILWSWMHTYSR